MCVGPVSHEHRTVSAVMESVPHTVPSIPHLCCHRLEPLPLAQAAGCEEHKVTEPLKDKDLRSKHMEIGTRARRQGRKKRTHVLVLNP